MPLTQGGVTPSWKTAADPRPRALGKEAVPQGWGLGDKSKLGSQCSCGTGKDREIQVWEAGGGEPLPPARGCGGRKKPGWIQELQLLGPPSLTTSLSP